MFESPLKILNHSHYLENKEAPGDEPWGLKVCVRLAGFEPATCS